MGQSAACATVLTRVVGPEATDLVILCRPPAHPGDAARQAEAVYRTLAGLLDGERASFRHVTAETLFLRDVGRDLTSVLEVRERILADVGIPDEAPPAAFVGQAPVAPDALFELITSVVIPHPGGAWSTHDVQADSTCACDGCSRSGARLVRLGDETSLVTTNVYGRGNDAFAEAFAMFCEAERLLQRCGMGFRDVVRTWIHLRDIDRDYDALNAARREFFRQRGVAPRPASTGVQGIPFPDAHDFSLRLQALRSPRPLDLAPMSTPALSEAWSYGADFSRGLRVGEANRTTLHVSGTASIDESGATVHVGDFEAQANRMLHNIATLLARQGASFEHVVSAIAYVKRVQDAAALQATFRARGFYGFPCVVVEAPLCRPELLCEVEAVALLPLPPGKA